MVTKSRTPKKLKPLKIDSGLTLKQETFCLAYVGLSNATEAFREAFDCSSMSDKTVNEKASLLLNSDKVRARIDFFLSRKVAKLEQRFDITPDRVIQELAAIAFANADDYYSWGTQTVKKTRKDGTEYEVEVPTVRFKSSDELTLTQKKAITGVELTFSKTGDPTMSVKMADKRAALVDLGKHLGLFKDKVEHRHVVAEFQEAAEASRQKLLALIDAAVPSENEMKTVN